MKTQYIQIQNNIDYKFIGHRLIVVSSFVSTIYKADIILYRLKKIAVLYNNPRHRVTLWLSDYDLKQNLPRT